MHKGQKTRVRVKVCGITNYEDAARALELGADALGFNFHPPSPRYIAPEAVRNIVRRLPPLAVSVGVFVNIPDPLQVETMARAAGVQVLQLHGDESPDYCRVLAGWPLIKAARIGSDDPPDPELHRYPAQALLLDAKDEHLFGGTGRTLDWAKARAAGAGLRIILAGGLNPDNVRRAIRMVEPYGVDVCSGVESTPGKKDHARLTAFLNEVFDAYR